MDPAAELAELPLDRAMYVFVLGEVPGGVLCDRGQPLVYPAQLVVAEQPGAVQALRVRDVASQS